MVRCVQECCLPERQERYCTSTMSSASKDEQGKGDEEGARLLDKLFMQDSCRIQQLEKGQTAEIHQIPEG